MLRRAISKNQVSFPSQIPVFKGQPWPDVQWRLVQLYFVHQWRFADIGKRYHVTPQRVTQIVTLWRIRAVTLGYIQEIPAETDLRALSQPAGNAEGKPYPTGALPSDHRNWKPEFEPEERSLMHT
jgi:hypothetical protein